MAIKIILVIFVCFKLTVQDVETNEVNDLNKYAEAASSFLKEQNVENLEGLVSNLINSGGAKQIGDMLMNSGVNKDEAASQILQGLGSLLNQNSEGKGGFDPSIIGNILGALNLDGNDNNKNEDGFGNLLSVFSGLAGGGGGGGMMSLLPMLLSTVNSFTGPEADKRIESHAGHAWFLPPILEKFHLMFDHFMNSEIGRAIVNSVGAEKIVKVFADQNGKFSFARFAELLENHSFRKYWIQLVTKRIATVVSYFANPKVQTKFLTTVQYFLNSFLRGQGVPKSALFDPTRPTETISALINYGFKKFVNMRVNSKQYVKPAILYVQDLFRLVQQKGFLTGSGIDSREFSDKLTDTINLEIIEPGARVYRAYRFAKKVPQCDKYVMCLVNEENENEQLSLPGLKKLLSKASSIIASWFLTGHTSTSFWGLYEIISEDQSCKALFKEACNDFHVEEIKVTTEYVHNEL